MNGSKLIITNFATGQTKGTAHLSVLALVKQMPTHLSIWRGYGADKPFDVPEPVIRRYLVQLDGQQILVDAGKERAYCYHFSSVAAIAPYADKNGNHYGSHPDKGAYWMPLSYFEAVERAADIAAKVHLYPPVPSPTNYALWRRVYVAPKKQAVNIRFVPSINNNIPIGVYTAPNNLFAVLNHYNNWGAFIIANSVVFMEQSVLTIAPERHVL